ncbi:hypothetical protein B0J17DRAFT_765239 [Rhizoctonia solani]|nr:hypothetical protein B0J17DRAFT_765239 [Rhizoctonia solani]
MGKTKSSTKVEATKVKAVAPAAAPVKTKSKKEKKAAPPPPPVESSDSSSEESSSEDEPPKPVTKTNGVAKASPAKAAAKAADSDSDSDSSSDEEPSKAAVVKPNGKAAAKDDSSDSDSDSESESEPAKPAAKTAAVNGKPAPAKKDDTTSDSDSDSDSEPAKPAKAAAVAVKAVTNGKPAAKDEGSDSDSSDSDSSEEDAKPAAAKAAPAKAAAAKAEDSDSSDSSDSSDEDGDVEMKDAPAVTAMRKAEEPAQTPAKKAKTEVATEGGESNTVFVGRLSWNVDNDWLSTEFAGCGTVVAARVQMDRNTGKSRGFAYVEFSSPAEAQKAVAEMNGKQIDGREVNVDISQPRQPNPEKRAQVFGDSESQPSTTLFVGNLSWNSNEDSLWNVFGEFGDVTHVRVPTDQESGKPKGFGYVEFGDQASATKAFEAMKGKDLDGRTLRLDYSQPRGEGGGRGGGRGGDAADVEADVEASGVIVDSGVAIVAVAEDAVEDVAAAEDEVHPVEELVPAVPSSSGVTRLLSNPLVGSQKDRFLSNETYCEFAARILCIYCPFLFVLIGIAE